MSCKNICLEHLLHKQRNLTRLDIVGVADGMRSIYYFVDAHGYVSTSIEDSSEEARRDLLETLSYYGFRPAEDGRESGSNFHVTHTAYYFTSKASSLCVIGNVEVTFFPVCRQIQRTKKVRNEHMLVLKDETLGNCSYW